MFNIESSILTLNANLVFSKLKTELKFMEHWFCDGKLKIARLVEIVLMRLADVIVLSGLGCSIKTQNITWWKQITALQNHCQLCRNWSYHLNVWLMWIFKGSIKPLEMQIIERLCLDCYIFATLKAVMSYFFTGYTMTAVRLCRIPYILVYESQFFTRN